MVCALADYLCYRLGVGRYAHNSHFLRHWSSEEMTEPLLRTLQTGDCLFVHTKGSFLAWLIMYVSCSPISHIALYAGSGRILHATTGGSGCDNIAVLFRNGSVVLPVIAPVGKEKRGPFEDVSDRYIGIPYGWKGVIQKGLFKLLARDLPGYRLKFFADFLALVLLLDFVLYATLHKFMFIWVLVPYVLLLTTNAVLWLRHPLPYDRMGTPKDMFTALRRAGARTVFNAGQLEKVPPGVMTTDMYVLYRQETLLSAESLNKVATTVHPEFEVQSLDIGNPSKQCAAVRYRESTETINFQTVSAQEIKERLGLTEVGAATCGICLCSSPDYQELVATVLFAATLTKSLEGSLYNPGLGRTISFSNVNEVTAVIVEEIEKARALQNQRRTG